MDGVTFCEPVLALLCEPLYDGDEQQGTGSTI